MTWVRLIIVAIVAFLKSWFGSESEQGRKDKELDKKKARLKVLEMEIEDAKKDLADAENLDDSDTVNNLTSHLERLSAERDNLKKELPA